MSDFPPGSKITVSVDGVDYETQIDEHGTQRFLENPDNALLKSVPYIQGGTRAFDYTGPDLNQLSIDYQRGKFSKREYMEAKMALGYSVCGFLEIFGDVLLINPLFEGDDGISEGYLIGQLRQEKMTLTEFMKEYQRIHELETIEEAERLFVKNNLLDF